MRISLIVAMSENGVIGRDGGLPWRIPGDLKFFKAMTMGKPMVMGRKTFASIGKPLPGRTNIVVTRDRGFTSEGVVVAHDLDGALSLAHDAMEDPANEEAMIIGGAQIYEQALPRADRLYVTEVHQHVKGDTRFPDFDRLEWVEVSRENVPAEGDIPAYSLVVLERAA
ncbi:MAG: dihydrofolate reductase [Rhodospirillales bacterium]|nr:dihydrofolate reductase [Rhodospirillales bacterium]